VIKQQAVRTKTIFIEVVAMGSKPGGRKKKAGKSRRKKNGVPRVRARLSSKNTKEHVSPARREGSTMEAGWGAEKIGRREKASKKGRVNQKRKVL